MPIIKKQELEHSFVHVIDEVSGHLIEIMDAEERGATNEDEGTDEILVWEMGMRHTVWRYSNYYERDILFHVQLEEDFKRYPVGESPKHVMDEEIEVYRLTYYTKKCICLAGIDWIFSCFCAIMLQPIVTQFGEELKGDERVVVDQLITKQQCQRLIELATVSSSLNVNWYYCYYGGSVFDLSAAL